MYLNATSRLMCSYLSNVSFASFQISGKPVLLSTTRDETLAHLEETRKFLDSGMRFTHIRRHSYRFFWSSLHLISFGFASDNILLMIQSLMLIKRSWLWCYSTAGTGHLRLTPGLMDVWEATAVVFNMTAIRFSHQVFGTLAQLWTFPRAGSSGCIL